MFHDPNHVTDASALFAALQLSATSTSRRLAIVEPVAAYPQVRIIGGEWCRQNGPGGQWWPVSAAELRELLKLEAA